MNILVAVDASPSSENVIAAVVSRPWPTGTKVRVLSVAPMTLGMPVPGVPITGAIAPAFAPLAPAEMQAEMMLRDEARAWAQRVAARLPAELCPTACSRQGSPGDEIVDEAKKWPADLVMLGAHSRHHLRSLAFGGVASHVVRHAPCSVEVVR